jgi:hypothetical protein
MIERPTPELTARLKDLHNDMVDGINDVMTHARDNHLDYAVTISNLMMLVAHLASTFAVFHFEFTEDAFTDVMREHYKMAQKGRTSPATKMH